MKTIRLRENVGLRFAERTCEIHGPRGLKLIDQSEEQIALLRSLGETGVASGRVNEFGAGEQAVLKKLAQQKLLRLHEDDYSRDEIWLSHYVPDARAALEALKNKRVMIAGCGGTGAIVADHLARAGAMHFVLIDGAELDAPDLNRQWTYTANAVGKRKTDLLAAHLKNNFGAEVTMYDRYLATEADLADLKEEICDLIVWCADKPRLTIERLALRLAAEHDTPLLFGAVGITDEQVGPLVLSETDRAREAKRLDQEESLDLVTRTIQGSVCFTNTIAAAKIGFMAYKFLLGLRSE